MAFLLLVPGFRTTRWERRILEIEPDLDLRIWPEVGNPDEIRFALSWQHPAGEFQKYKNLECIASIGAGVDHILCDPDLPDGVPITRIVDPSMPQAMSEYVVMNALNYCRHTDLYGRRQIERQWKPKRPKLPAELTVGIMGMGQLGSDCAAKLRHLGFSVAGWSRSPKNTDGLRHFWGDGQLPSFLGRCDILVCMLPLTPQTRNILDRDLFRQLPPDAYLINVARGEHLAEEDLLAALDEGHLSGACLDVFRTEPLPADHPFWRHPHIRVTPHISSLTDPQAVVPQIMDNYRRLLAGQPLLHLVDVQRGY